MKEPVFEKATDRTTAHARQTIARDLYEQSAGDGAEGAPSRFEYGLVAGVLVAFIVICWALYEVLAWVGIA